MKDTHRFEGREKRELAYRLGFDDPQSASTSILRHIKTGSRLESAQANSTSEAVSAWNAYVTTNCELRQHLPISRYKH